MIVFYRIPTIYLIIHQFWLIYPLYTHLITMFFTHYLHLYYTPWNSPSCLDAWLISSTYTLWLFKVANCKITSFNRQSSWVSSISMGHGWNLAMVTNNQRLKGVESGKPTNKPSPSHHHFYGWYKPSPNGRFIVWFTTLPQHVATHSDKFIPLLPPTDPNCSWLDGWYPQHIPTLDYSFTHYKPIINHYSNRFPPGLVLGMAYY